MTRKKKPTTSLIRSSAAEYLTFVRAGQRHWWRRGQSDGGKVVMLAPDAADGERSFLASRIVTLPWDLGTTMAEVAVVARIAWQRFAPGGPLLIADPCRHETTGPGAVPNSTGVTEAAARRVETHMCAAA